MILRRLGNKRKIAHLIQAHFPPHTVYCEPFFGAGGMFFNKRKAKYNILNDIDSDVFNLFMVLRTHRKELEEAFYEMPIHEDLLRYWEKNEETDPIQKAIRFLFLSNFTFRGAGGSIAFGTENHKYPFWANVEKTQKVMEDVQFSNRDFRVFFNLLRRRNEKFYFVYCDPPYVKTGDNYSNSFKINDHEDLQRAAIDSGFKFAISEFANADVIALAKENNLHIETICERNNMGKPQKEILIMNYKLNKLF